MFSNYILISVIKKKKNLLDNSKYNERSYSLEAIFSRPPLDVCFWTRSPP